MAENTNMKSDQEDESRQVIVERSTLHLEANESESYEVDLNKSGAQEIVENLPSNEGGKDGTGENSKTIEDKPERMVVEGQEDYQGEQNNPEADNKEPFLMPLDRQNDQLTPTIVNSPAYQHSPLPSYQQSRINLGRHMERVNRANNDPSAPPLSTVDRHQQRRLSENPGVAQGDFYMDPRMSGNNRSSLNGRQHFMSGERRSVRMPGLQDFGPTSNYTPDNSAVSQVINQHLNMAAINLQCAQQLSGRRSGIPSWTALVGAWRRRNIRRHDVMGRSLNDSMAPRVYNSSSYATEDRTDHEQNVVNAAVTKAADEMMIKWAETTDDNSLADHPLLKIAIKRGIIERAAAKRMRRSSGWSNHQIDMEIYKTADGNATSITDADTTTKVNADAKANINADAKANVDTDATADSDTEVAANADIDEAAKADNTVDDAGKKPPSDDEDDNGGGASRMSVGLMNHP